MATHGRKKTVPTSPDLDGKVALVTGGSRGIGAATCRMLAHSGAKVVVNGRDQAAIDAVVADIWNDDGHVIGCSADCTDFAAIEDMRRHVEREMGPVDVLVAFAGGGGEPVPTEEMTEPRWRVVLEANLTTTFLTMKSFLPGMIERRSGSIITMASSAARLPALSSAAYAAAQAGIVMLARHVAGEVGKHQVRVNCVAPSAVLTERVQRLLTPAKQQDVAASFPLGRLGTPDDVALATLFLASESSSWLTGVTLDVAGGRVMI